MENLLKLSLIQRCQMSERTYIPLTSTVKVAVLLPALFVTLTLYIPASFGLMFVTLSPVCQASVWTEAWTPLDVSGVPLKNHSTVGSGRAVKLTSMLTLVPDRQLSTLLNRSSYSSTGSSVVDTQSTTISILASSSSVCSATTVAVWLKPGFH